MQPIIGWSQIEEMKDDIQRNKGQNLGTILKVFLTLLFNELEFISVLCKFF